jgi:hypothetical protein
LKIPYRVVIMICIDIMGGLGNQLFQLCALISHCLDNNLTFGIRKVNGSTAPLCIRPVYWNTFFQSLSPFLYDSASYSIGYQEPHFHYTDIKKDIADNSRINGYFQSYRYFDHNYNVIDALIKLSEKRQLVKKNSKINSENTVSLHFRAGDYIQCQQYHPLLSTEYYVKALLRIQSETGTLPWNVIYYYELQDQRYAASKIAELAAMFPDVTFTGCDHTLSDWEQMLHMSLCTHNIMANSTYSWWACYINHKITGTNVICYPSKWFGPSLQSNTNDLCPPAWIKI